MCAFSGSYLQRGSHRIGQNLYHMEWCPKYRYSMFMKDENKKLCEDVLKVVAQRHGIKLEEICVGTDHVHIVADVPPTMSVSRAFNLLKGASAYELFRRQPKFRLRYPRGHFWSPGKFYRTVGDADLNTVITYVREQKDQSTLNQFN